MITHTCTCTACPGGLTFSAPAGFISGSPGARRDQIHNYAHMVRSPVIGPVLAARGVKAVG